MAIEQIGQAGEVITGERNKIQLDIQSYDGVVKVAVRQWFTLEDNPDKWIPTKKGFTLSPVQAADLGKLLLSIDAEQIGTEYKEAVGAVKAQYGLS